MAVLSGQSYPALRLQFCKCTQVTTIALEVRLELQFEQLVIYSADAKARSYRISENLLWLERRCSRCSGQIQPALHGEGYYPKSGVPLGNGDQEWAAAFAVCRNQRPHACRRQRRGSRTLSRREQTRRSERCYHRCSH